MYIDKCKIKRGSEHVSNLRGEYSAPWGKTHQGNSLDELKVCICESGKPPRTDYRCTRTRLRPPQTPITQQMETKSKVEPLGSRHHRGNATSESTNLDSSEAPSGDPSSAFSDSGSFSSSYTSNYPFLSPFPTIQSFRSRWRQTTVFGSSSAALSWAGLVWQRSCCLQVPFSAAFSKSSDRFKRWGAFAM